MTQLEELWSSKKENRIGSEKKNQSPIRAKFVHNGTQIKKYRKPSLSFHPTTDHSLSAKATYFSSHGQKPVITITTWDKNRGYQTKQFSKD